MDRQPDSTQESRTASDGEPESTADAGDASNIGVAFGFDDGRRDPPAMRWLLANPDASYDDWVLLMIREALELHAKRYPWPGLPVAREAGCADAAPTSADGENRK